MNPNPRTPKCQEGSPGKGTGGLALPPLPLRPLAAASSGSCWQYWLLTVLPKGPLGAGQAPGSHKGPAEGAWADNPDRHPAASSCPTTSGPVATAAHCRQMPATREVS